METGEKEFGKSLDRQEIRCAECGKLILKGKVERGELLLRCPNRKCVYHKKDLRIRFV